ncbi:MAG: hypothetical protein MR871_09060 [Lachnospiraceae bacterium]|nr:hypothetical protein [Lachnospiraceae bacterium]
MNELMTINNTQVVSCEVVPEINSCFDCSVSNIQLNEREQKAVLVNFESGLYEMAAEFVWRRTISIMKDRLEFFGKEFIADMLGYDKDVSIDRISEQEIIELNCDIGFLKQNAKVELLHHAEQIRMYSSRECQMIEKIGINKNQARTLIDDCIRYVLSDMTECKMLSFTNIREMLKSKLLTATSEEVIQLSQEQYFQKRTVLRSLLNMARTEKQEEKEFVFHNMSVIVPAIWDSLAEVDKYNFGTVYAEISSSDKKDYVKTMKTILFNVHGFDYVPENLKSNSFISAAKNLLSMHNGINNFYNEPLAAKMLASMGTMIPDPALYECLNATLICVMGNEYEHSWDAQKYLQEILDGVTTAKWELFLRDLSRNSELLFQIAYVGIEERNVKRWCDEIEKRNLQRLAFNDIWINEFLTKSAEFNLKMVRRLARERYTQIKG